MFFYQVDGLWQIPSAGEAPETLKCGLTPSFLHLFRGPVFLLHYGFYRLLHPYHNSTKYDCLRADTNPDQRPLSFFFKGSSGTVYINGYKSLLEMRNVSNSTTNTIVSFV